MVIPKLLIIKIDKDCWVAIEELNKTTNEKKYPTIDIEAVFSSLLDSLSKSSIFSDFDHNESNFIRIVFESFYSVGQHDRNILDEIEIQLDVIFCSVCIALADIKIYVEGELPYEFAKLVYPDSILLRLK
jgi:hypothetical protein